MLNVNDISNQIQKPEGTPSSSPSASAPAPAATTSGATAIKDKLKNLKRKKISEEEVLIHLNFSNHLNFK
jgi:hypothetical protein